MQTTMINSLDTFEAAVRLFIQTVKHPQAWQLITERAGVDIDRPAAAILMVLTSQPPTQCRLQDLAHHLNIEAPSVTRKVQQLELGGYIDRQQDDQDRRAFSLNVTKKGSVVAQKLRDAQLAVVREALSSWSSVERDTFVSLFDRFSKEMASLYNVKLTKPVHV